MRNLLFKTGVGVLVALGVGAFAAAADDYTIDTAHTSVTFKISHLGLSHVHGRFNDVSGSFTVDPDDPAKTSFKLNIKTQSVDTNNSGRDIHLRSPDFFNAKQYSSVNFVSTDVKPVEGGYEVTGDLTLHGTTKPVTFTLKGGGKAEFPKGTSRTGFATDFTLKRTDFGVGKKTPVLGDDVYVSIGFEGVKKK
jgi:polyisoprenoid-binding protein YceI